MVAVWHGAVEMSHYIAKTTELLLWQNEISQVRFVSLFLSI